MYDNILEAIKSYYNQKNTDYAILLNGDWGTGKTFFVENILKKDAIINENCKVISISSSGINDIDSFINNIYLRIALEKLPSYKKKKKIYKSIIKGIGLLSNTLNNIPIDSFSKYGKIGKFIVESIKKFIVNKESDFSNILFVIDDIERISDSVNIEDILYKIYELFILKGLKVIFVCNEKEIYSDNEEKQSKYFKIKEKVIRHTINFYRLDNSMFSEIIKSIIKDNEKYGYYKNFINDNNHIEKLINIFVEMNHLNIRTFLTYLDLSSQIFNIKEIQKDTDFIKDLLYKLALVIVAIINVNEDMLDEYCINANYDKYKEYSDKINKLRIFIYPTTIYIDIKKYVKTGYLETLNIIEDYNSIIHSKKRRKFSEYYEKLQNYNIHNENNIKEAIKFVFNKIKECLNNSNEAESEYTTEYLRDFKNLKGYIDLYDENIYKKEIEEYIELTKKIDDNFFYRLNLSVDSDIEKVASYYDFYYNNKKYNKPTYKNNRIYKIDEYYEYKLNEAYKKAKENIENILIKIFEDKKMGQYFYFNPYINRFPIYNLIMEYNFLIKLEVNAYNIDVIIKFLYINMLKISNASDSFDRNNEILTEVKKYLNDDKIKNGNYDNNTKKQIDELKSVVEKAKEHIKPNK